MTDEEWEAIRKSREEDQKEDEKRSRVERQNSKKKEAAKYLMWSKLALLLVVIGFFMPISCNLNGYELISFFAFGEGNDFLAGLLLIVCFLSVAASLFYSLANKFDFETESAEMDWGFLAVSVGSFVLAVLKIGSFGELQIGACFIFAGWFLSGLFLFDASKAGG